MTCPLQAPESSWLSPCGTREHFLDDSITSLGSLISGLAFRPQPNWTRPRRCWSNTGNEFVTYLFTSTIINLFLTWHSPQLGQGAERDDEGGSYLREKVVWKRLPSGFWRSAECIWSHELSGSWWHDNHWRHADVLSVSNCTFHQNPPSDGWPSVLLAPLPQLSFGNG